MMWLKVRCKLNGLFISSIFNLLGVGLKEQNLFHWTLFTLRLVYRFFLIYFSMCKLKFNLTPMTLLLINITSQVFIVLLVLRAKKIGQLLMQAKNLTKKNYFILKIADAAVVLLFLSSIATEFTLKKSNRCYFSTHLVLYESNSAVVQVATGVVCSYEYILFSETDLIYGLYFVLFLITHFVKMQKLEEISLDRTSGWRRRIFLSSDQISQLHEQFEDSASFILFIKAVRQFFSILLFFFNVFLLIQGKMDLNSTWGKMLLFKSIRDIIMTTSLFLFISLMQEDIDRKCSSMSKEIIYSGYLSGSLQDNLVLANIVTGEFGRRVTIWKIVQVSRSILITLASVYVAFPVLFLAN